MSRRKNKHKTTPVDSMKCSPNCIYFMATDVNDYEMDIYGVKYAVDHVFKCGYDGHIITNWYEKCPKTEEEITGESD